MALTAAAGLGETNNSGSATIALSPSRNVEVGEFIVITLTSRDYSLSSVADNSSQTGTANSYATDVAKTTIDPYVYIVSCQVTRKILTTDTITVTWAGSASQRSTMCVVALPDANESAQLDKTSSRHSFSAASTYTSNAVATTAQADEYAVGVAAFAASGVNAGTITADSPWTLEYSATVGSGYTAAHGSQVLTATGTPAFTGDWGATETGQQEAAIATYKGTAGSGATPADTDPGTGTDNSLVVAVIDSDSDTGTGVDSSTPIASDSSADTGAGVDSSALVITDSGTDTGTGVDSSALVAIDSDSDAGVGADASAVQTDNSKSDNDLGTGSDVSSIEAVSSSSDTGVGDDTSGFLNAPALTDNGTGTDSAAVDVQITSSEIGTGNDSTASGAIITGAEGGSGSETSSLSTDLVFTKITGVITRVSPGSVVYDAPPISATVGDP